MEEDDPEVPTIEEDTANPDEIMRTVLAYLEWQTSRGRSNDPTQQLEGLVRRDGYEQGKLKTTVYDDVIASTSRMGTRWGLNVLGYTNLSQVDAI